MSTVPQHFIQQLADTYQSEGIVRLQQLLHQETLSAVKGDIARGEKLANQDLVEHWNGKRLTFYSKNPIKSSDAKTTENFVMDPYFQSSKNSCHVFFEEIENQIVLNRMGHGLHLHPQLNNIQRLVYDNPFLHSLLKELGYRRPICLLSVYIPKHTDGFGSEVRPHQESAFANTNPLSACVLWVALEDATIENACMYGLPGSHQLPLKFVSNVDHERGERRYVTLSDVDIPPFDPEESKYVPLEVSAGHALLFHGNYVHCSPRNRSSCSRKALSFQFIETEGVAFSTFNWIQTPNQAPLYV
ncbi:MAG: phytanoyl-CoA dioxygenase family protein, partial [Proteobacteria bacterium]|nr:phytanoyl-CoA dioxygenase family protein [Pseudomonadota bacterium]